MDEKVPVTSPAAMPHLVRVMKVAFIVSAMLFLFMVIKIPTKASRPPDPKLEMAIMIVALTMVVLGYVMPRVLAGIAQRAVGDASQAVKLQGWFTRNILGFAFMESCSLFGVMLHFLGAELWRSELLIGVGIVTTVFFSAGPPPQSEEGDFAQG